MIPKFNKSGNLPPGIHNASWEEFTERFGKNDRRKELLKGLEQATLNLKIAGCTLVYIDGSFISSKEIPGDYDGCWKIDGVNPDLLDPIFLDEDDLANERVKQKEKYGGEMFPADIPEGMSGKTFLEFFQLDGSTGETKGIIAIEL